MSVYIEEYHPARNMGRGGSMFGAESFGRADPAGLLEHGFVNITPQVHEYLQSQGHDAEITPLFYNPETKLYGVSQGRGLMNIQKEPRIVPTVNGSSNVFGQIGEALYNLRLPLAVFTAGGTFAIGEGAAAASGGELAGEEAAQSLTVQTVENTNMLDLSPDLLEGGEGIDIFQLESATQEFPGWTTNPSIADLENGGEGAGLPGMTPNEANFPSLKTIATGAKTVLELATANKVAQARVAQARQTQARVAQARQTQPVPTSTTPNFRSFLSHPGQSLGDMFSPSGGASSNLPAIIIAGIIVVLSLFLMKR